MSHQPFESWLLDETNPSPEQEAALRAHLETCPECRKIYSGWLAARETLQLSRMARPAPGFSQRFTASLAERRALQAHRRQIRNLILGLALGVIASAGLLILLIFAVNSPVDLLVKATQGITGLVSWWNQTQQVLFVALQLPVFLGIWILLSSGICLLVIGWLFTLWRISHQGAQQS
jgi:predicted anti-sigma-YlaC factor YlaD